MALLFALSAQPGSSLPQARADWLPIPLDALAHLGLYGVLGLLLGVAAAPRGRGAWGGLLLACAAYGLSDELHQLLVPGRAFELWDLIFDGLGGGAGLALVGWGRGKRSRKP